MMGIRWVSCQHRNQTLYLLGRTQQNTPFFFTSTLASLQGCSVQAYLRCPTHQQAWHWGQQFHLTVPHDALSDRLLPFCQTFGNCSKLCSNPSLPLHRLRVQETSWLRGLPDIGQGTQLNLNFR